MDMFTPVRMRLHPLSRAVTSPFAVEARLEFTDQFGDAGKGVGEAQFVLFAYDPIALEHKGRRIGMWSVSLATPDDNRAHWDAITRTYVFKLTPDATAVGSDHGKFVLSAEFRLPNGENLSDQITLAVK
ncbi:MAG TPA: hypothetical protein VM008_02465 [Phycisphaerae bacterium]|nr:hypothetical protein [Phycisphaerae bacterium]